MFDLGQRAKPILKWAGGKSGSLSQLVLQFPTVFKRYVEPFVGGGAVFLSLKSNVPAILNDSNEDVMELFGVVRDRPIELMKEIDSLKAQYSEKFFYRLRKRIPVTRVSRSARLVFLNRTGFNGLYRLNSKGQFNVPFGKYAKCPPLYDTENVLAVSKRLKSCILMSCDFEDVLEQAKRGDFVYCDPPYQPMSETSSFQGYTTEGFSRDQQERLKDACLRAVRRGATVAVSSSQSKEVLSMYEGFSITKVTAQSKISSRGNLRGKITEVLIMMIPRPRERRPERNLDELQFTLPML